MSYLYSLAGTLCLLVLLTAIGNGVVDLLPFRQRGLGRLFLRPAFGFSILLLCATLAGWTVGERSGLTIPVTLLLALAGFLRARDKAALGRNFLFVAAVGAVVSTVFLLPILLYKCYQPVSDIFTYLVHGQWLQTHSFRDPTWVSFDNVFESQVNVYQNGRLRMGGSFLFAWVQACSPFAWSSDVYPIYISTLLAIGALGISAQVYALTRRRRWLSALFGIGAVTAPSGFTFGCCFGFMPQSSVLCLLPAVTTLLTNFPFTRGGAPRVAGRLLPLALVIAAAGYAYHELMPFTLLTIGVWFGVNLLARTPRRRILQHGAILLLLLLALWNHELYRMSKSIPGALAGGNGWPARWPPIAFFGHAIGLHAGAGDNGQWFFHKAVFGILLTYLCGGLIVAGVCRLLRTWKSAANSVHLVAFCLLGIGFFIHYRYGVPSPWHDDLGDTFLQIKLTNWTAPLFLSLLGFGLLRFAVSRRAALAIGALLLAWTGMNLVHEGKIVAGRAALFNRQAGVREDAFQVFKDFRRAVLEQCHGQFIYLDLNGGEQTKLRQIFVYFLNDQKLLSDWSDDGYLGMWHNPEWNKDLPLCRYCIRLAPRGGPADPGRKMLFQAGKYELIEMPRTLVSGKVTGEYRNESDPSGWWVWTAQPLALSFNVIGEIPRRAQVAFEAASLGQARRLTVRIHARSDLALTADIAPGEEITYVSPPFAMTETATVEISADGSPVRLSQRDPREVLFKAKNVRLAPLAEGAAPPDPAAILLREGHR